MYIKKIEVWETFPILKLVREVEFNSTGVSLIVDKTTKIDSGTTNSIGKSTVAKIIDICLGAKSAMSLYQDYETKNTNNQLGNYIKEKSVIAKTIISDGNVDITLERGLYKKGKRKINDTCFASKDFNKELNKIFFHLEEARPSFRQLIGKFLRVDAKVDENIFKFLPVCSNKDYDAIYSVLFSIQESDIISKKLELKKQLDDEGKILGVIKKNASIGSLGLLKQKQLIVRKELKELKEKRNEISYIEEYKNEFDEFVKLQNIIEEIEREILKQNLELEMVNSSIINKQKNIVIEDNQNLQILYNDATQLLREVSKSYKELIEFHNTMIENKINFLLKRKLMIENELNSIKEKYASILQLKASLSISSIDKNIFKDFIVYSSKIEEKSKAEGELNSNIGLYEKQIEKISELNKLLEELERENSNDIALNNMSIFNGYFNTNTKELYDTQYCVDYKGSDNNQFPLEWESAEGSLGSGKKKAIILAFDLAYYAFAKQIGIKVPNFIIHDKLELTDQDKLIKIFKIAEDAGAQLIIPILKEKLDGLSDEQKEKMIKLELSENDKFFRI